MSVNRSVTWNKILVRRTGSIRGAFNHETHFHPGPVGRQVTERGKKTTILKMKDDLTEEKENHIQAIPLYVRIYQPFSTSSVYRRPLRDVATVPRDANPGSGHWRHSQTSMTTITFN